jgi:hypothetical protein
MLMRSSSVLALACLAACFCQPALAWGRLGHEVTALIAYRHLTPAVRVRVDAMLASDHDILTAPDFASRANWADEYRNDHRETSAWHFVDIEIDHPDLAAACFGFPPLAPGQLASQGPAKDCVVNKLDEFEAELRNPSTPAPERLLALKFVMHFAGDLEQPLHAADHQDRGGNCVGLSPPPDAQSTNLHAWWDTGVVELLGSSAQEIAADLDRKITRREAQVWANGLPRDWAMETFAVGQSVAYDLPSRPTCADHGSVALPAAYQAHARIAAAVQLERAGIRMATLLNGALD